MPEAIRKLGPSRAMLEDVARAKLQAQVNAITGRDSLSYALRNAGPRQVMHSGGRITLA